MRKLGGPDTSLSSRGYRAWRAWPERLDALAALHDAGLASSSQLLVEVGRLALWEEITPLAAAERAAAVIVKYRGLVPCAARLRADFNRRREYGYHRGRLF